MSDTSIVARLARVLPSIVNPERDGAGHHGRYLTLPTLLDTVRPILAAEGLAVLQTLGADGVRTLFVSVDGEMFDAGVHAVNWSTPPQQIGSAITFARRYALQAALGVSGVDDDGVAASKPQKRNEGPIRGDRSVTAAQIRALQAAYGSLERRERLALWSKVIGRSVTTAKELTAVEASTILDRGKP